MLPPDTTRTALLVVDIQQGLTHPTHWGLERSSPGFESNVKSILSDARSYNQKRPDTPILILHVHNYSTRLTSPLHPSYVFPDSGVAGVAPMEVAAPLPNEPVLLKSVNSAFIGTDLEERLRAFNTEQLVILGLSTDECVSTTVRMAANLKVLADDVLCTPHEGRIVVLSDATAAWAKGGFDATTVHEVHLASLNHEFATVETTGAAVRSIMECV